MKDKLMKAAETILISACLCLMLTFFFYIGGTIISDGCAPFLPAPLCVPLTAQEVFQPTPRQSPPSPISNDSDLSAAGPSWPLGKHGFGDFDTFSRGEK